ncbi:MAG: hypothetical protein J6A46_04065 [Clostridia bacterium]|nr:hypothetical protein [Clostridia bacterium]
MFKKPILEMYYGNLGRAEEINVQTKEHERFLSELIEADEEIKLLMKEEKLLSLYNKAMDSLEGVYSEEIACYYAYAFRCGVLIGMDIAGFFDDKSNLT